jgi:hypothetical protein
MTNEDAAAVIFVSLEVLNYRRVYKDQSPAALPMGLLRQALEHIEELVGEGETSSIRERFANYGLDFSDLSTCADRDLCAEKGAAKHQATGLASRTETLQDSTNIGGTQSQGYPSKSRIPTPVEEAIRAKYRAGWSKSRIAREFRLNRRTVIRICSGSENQGN